MILNCINRKYFIVVQSINSKKNLILPVNSRASIYTRAFLCDSDQKYKQDDKTINKDDKQETNKSNKKKQTMKEKLSKFSFISLEKEANKKAQSATEMKMKSFNREKRVEKSNERRSTFDMKIFESSKDVKIESDSAMKLAKLISTEEPEKTAKEMLKPFSQSFDEKYKQRRIESETALKIAKLVDDENVEKIAETIMTPLTKMREKRDKIINDQKSIKLKDQKKTEDADRQPKNKDGEKQKYQKPISREETKSKFPRDIYKKEGFGKRWESNSYQIFQNLKSGNGLSIFTKVETKEAKPTEESFVWSMHHEDELRKAQDVPSINGFDEMIKLTNEGKLWKFPIDNEQDVDETDASIPFYEHVFLDKYLEEFPDIEPIQQFMVLVLNALSHNGFLSVNEKKEIINWYKKYFKDKEDIIKEALEAEKQEQSYRSSVAGNAS